MVKIEDGKGREGDVAVSSEQRLLCHAVVETGLEHASENSETAYSWSSGTQATSNGDTLLLVKNTSATPLHIHSISISVDTDTRVIIHVPTTVVTTPAGTAITGVNMNFSSSLPAEATAKRDETNNTQGDILWAGEVMAASNPVIVNFDGAIILPKNESIGVDIVLAQTALCDVTIIGHYGGD